MVSTGPKFAALQRAAEVERGREFEALWIPGLHHCACCLQGGCAVCFCVRVVGASFWNWRRLMNSAFPASPAASRPHLSITRNGYLLFIEPLFLALYNFSRLPLEELTAGTLEGKMEKENERETARKD